MTTLVIFEMIDVHFWNRSNAFNGLVALRMTSFVKSDILWKVLFPCSVVSSLASNDEVFFLGICHFKAQRILERFSL